MKGGKKLGNLRLSGKIIILLNISFTVLLNSFTKVGTTGGLVLKMGMGAKAQGIGEAVGSVYIGPEGIFYNPASLISKDVKPTLNITGNYTSWIAGIKNGSAGVIIPADGFSLFALSAIYLTSGEMEVTMSDVPENTGIYFDFSSIVMGITYSRLLTSRFSFGLTAKYIEERIWHEKGATFAFDFGGVYLSDFGINMGVSIKNLGGKIQLKGEDLYLEEGSEIITDNWSLPLLFQLGISKRFFKDKMLLSADIVHHSEGYDELRVGGELSLFKVLCLRIGKSFSIREGGFSFGVGFSKNNISIDFSASTLGILGWTEKVSIAWKR